ncbi:MAG: B12-binding domain-containing radical SAM protein [Candidatus Methylomirabilis sp.]|nr:B12-binding domain-containing radical SAM protein [Deltaproteobacteria bacterium]
MADARKALWIYPSPETAGYEITNRIDHRIIRKPPLGMLYLASVLGRERGRRSEVWDQTARAFGLADLIAKVRAERPAFVGFYADTELRAKVVRYVRTLTAAVPEVPALVGGPGAQQPEAYVKAGARAVALGEAERTILEIDEHLRGERSLAHVGGIAHLGPEGIAFGPERPLIENLDELPFPDRSLLPVGDYYDYQIVGMRRPYVTVMASRGCYFRCTFCSSPRIWGREVRLRSPENVVAEIEECVRRWGARYVGFHDDIFGFDDDWSDAFCEAMARRPWRVRWACMAHPFTFRKRGAAKLADWKRAGADFIAFGLQSAEGATLREIQRSRSEPEVLAEVVAEAKRLGILTKVEFIFGLPGDTRETMERDVEYALRVRPHAVKFFSLSLLEGSDLGDRYAENAEVCEVPFDEVKRLSARAMRRYYLSPRTVWQIVRYAARWNPGWFLFAARFAAFFLRATGLRRA